VVIQRHYEILTLLFYSYVGLVLGFTYYQTEQKTFT